MLAGNENTAQPGKAENWHGTAITPEAQANFYDMMNASRAKENIEFLLIGFLQSPLAQNQIDGGSNAEMTHFCFRLIDLVTSVNVAKPHN